MSWQPQGSLSPSAHRSEVTIRDGRSRESLRGSSLTWKAPHLQSKHKSGLQTLAAQNLNSHDTATPLEQPADHGSNNIGSEKVTFNGLKGVPTGPKQNHSILSQSLMLPDEVDRAFKRCPHIFISTKWLPAKVATVKHLHLFLRNYAAHPSDVSLDKSGYYVSFENSDAGRELLEECYRNKAGMKLFGQYPLHMERFPHGQSVEEVQLHAKANHDSNLDTPDTAHSVAAAASADTFVNGVDMSVQPDAGLRPQSSTNSHPESLADFSSANVATSSASPADATTIPTRQFSPFRVPSRQDKDDSLSSTSGFTGSDMSASKRSRCHVCNTASSLETDPLVHCSSCPRRYHRRCHTNSEIPIGLEPDHAWQCRRCVRKQVQPRSRLCNNSIAVSPSPALSAAQSEEPPLKRVRIDPSEPSPHVNAAADLAVPNVTANGAATEGAADREEGHRMFFEGSFGGTERPVLAAETVTLNNNDRDLLAADKLVEQSFALSADSNHTPVKPPSRPKKLTLVRRKITQPEDPEMPPVKEASSAPKSPTGLTAQAETRQSQSDQPIAQHSPEHGSPERKSKSHKWVGGGADKDIIQSGQEHLFPRQRVVFLGQPSPQANTETLSNGTSNARPEAQEVASNPEVFESPKEARVSQYRGEVEESGAVANMASDFRGNDRLENSGSPFARVHSQDQSLSGGAVKQRMKPGRPALARCTKCNKKIAFNPLATNKLCSGCKKVLENSVKHSAGSASPQEKQSNQVNRSPTQLDRGFEERGYGLQGRRNDAELDVSGRGDHVVESGETASAVTSPQKPQPKACKECRGKHKRCIHRPGIPIANIGDKLEPDEDFEEQQPRVEDERSEGDLDFWTSRPDPSDPEPVADKPARSQHVEVDSPLKVVSMPNALEDEHVDNDSSDLASPGDTYSKSFGKRRSQTRPAVNEHDLGDSFTRPKKAYAKMIGMALCAAPGYRAKANDIVQWIAKNVPGYQVSKGSWEKGIRATITMSKEGYNGCKGLLRIVEDGTTKNEGYVYELIPGRASSLLHWDPVLMLPVSPPKGSRTGQREAEGASSVRGDKGKSDVLERKQPSTQLTASQVPASRAVLFLEKRRKRRDKRAEGYRPEPLSPDYMDLDVSNNTIATRDDGEIEKDLRHSQDLDWSPDEEPLATRQRAAGAKSIAGVDPPATDAPEDNANSMDIDAAGAEVDQAKVDVPPPVPPRMKDTTEPNFILIPRTTTLAELTKVDTKEKDFSAKSLFDEWPEYDPDNNFDRKAKIAEIQKRPTRKQRFKKPSVDPWIHASPVSSTVNGSSGGGTSSFERPYRNKRSAATSAYPWENGEENVIQCDTVEELFNLPKNPIAIIQDKRVVYRDGTRNDDGTLPRAKVIYKTGYA